jgi:hypothetical protein
MRNNFLHGRSVYKNGRQGAGVSPYYAWVGSFFSYSNDTVDSRVIFSENRGLIWSCGRYDLADSLLLVVSDFEQQTSSRPHKAMGLRDQPPHARQTVISSIQRPERLVQVNLRLERLDLTGGNVRWIGYDHVENTAQSQRSGPVSAKKLNTPIQSVPAGILACHPHRPLGNVGSKTDTAAQTGCQGQYDRPGAGSQFENTPRLGGLFR